MPSRSQRVPVIFSGDSDLNFKSIPDCKLWLKSTKGVTIGASSKVSSWKDQSGSGHDFVNAVAATSPLYIPARNTLNYKPTVQFVNGSSYYLACSSFVATGTAHTLMVAISPDSLTAVQEIFVSETPLLAMAHVGATLGQIGYYDTSWHQAGASTSATGGHTLAFKLSGTTGLIYKNGTQIYSGSYTARAMSGRAGLGASFDGSAQFLNGHIAEIGLWNRALSDAEMLLVQNHFKKRYGTP